MDYGATYRDIRASSGWTGEEIASRRDMRLDQPGPRLVDSHACAVRTQLDSTLFIMKFELNVHACESVRLPRH